MKFIHPIDSSKFIFSELSNLPDNYLLNPQRADFFEMIWIINYEGETSKDSDGSHYIYLIPPYRFTKLNLEGQKGCVIAFKREYLEEDNKEYALDVFNLFNMHGQYTGFGLDNETTETLQYLRLLIDKEYHNPMGTYLVLKSLLKVFLLNLIRMSQNYFLYQDINQKRVYQFIMLMDEYYKSERKADFYSSKMGISEKRINQILKEKMNKTLTQLLHERLTVEATRMLMTDELTIKEIAFNLNFDDPAYFSRFYKKQTGQSPEDFKNHHVNP
ncbi:AraC family transcriptional regulator [Chryseobacterium lactis]|uniref:AraC family transcriptional regulator n=1 Tax=Chryseobacterium lactis TaxID=1241981 RepID=A0A3G6RFN6_CHRLC|nr:helix-turn-helix domain-containing protein [Chryseobacterium lactis]AZA83190.1 helix-turn-helix domain-containing protein [Chryseobacterium lactis]AZB03575.1 helix-turn-helix domain-containing protein [Chryseobacterium lactis]PNW11919.1 AraC family transcriptional regulator [Chryseobacterium lactis]